MRDAVFGGLQLAVEDFTSVAASEVTGFGNGMKDLDLGGAVDGEIID